MEIQVACPRQHPLPRPPVQNELGCPARRQRPWSWCRMPEEGSEVEGDTMAVCPSPRVALSGVTPMSLLVATAASEAYSTCGWEFQKSLLPK